MPLSKGSRRLDINAKSSTSPKFPVAKCKAKFILKIHIIIVSQNYFSSILKAYKVGQDFILYCAFCNIAMLQFYIEKYRISSLFWNKYKYRSSSLILCDCRNSLKSAFCNFSMMSAYFCCVHPITRNIFQQFQLVDEELITTNPSWRRDRNPPLSIEYILRDYSVRQLYPHQLSAILFRVEICPAAPLYSGKSVSVTVAEHVWQELSWKAALEGRFMTPDMNVLEQFQRAQTTRRFAISTRELGYIFIYSLT